MLGDEQQPEALPGRSKQAQEAASHQNALLPISRIPVEILDEIFHYIRDAYASKPPFGSLKTCELHWIVVTWVCRRWRAVALDDPTLWSRLPKHSSKWMSIMLERVKNAPFSANLSEMLASELEDLVDRILARSTQFADFTVSFETDKEFKRIFSSFELSSTPNLKDLCLQLSNRNGVSVVPETAFCGAPLRSLHLYRVGISWTSHLFSASLLSLELLELQPGHRPTIPDLQSLSRKLTGLRSLALRDSFPLAQGVDIAAHNDINKITFFRVQDLDLYSETPKELNLFLNNTSFSETLTDATICVMCKEEPDLLHLAPTLAAIGRQKSLKSLVSNAKNLVLIARLNGFHSEWVEVQAFEPLDCERKSDDHAIFDTKTNISLELGLLGSPFGLVVTNFYTMFSDIFHAFEWKNLYELDLSSVSIKPPLSFIDTLATTFGGLSTIHTFCVGPLIANFVIEVLVRSAFPALETLIMVNVIFDPDYFQSYDAVDVGSLVSCINVRKQRGLTLKEGFFQQCHGLRLRHTGWLEEVVDKVVWDDECVFIDAGVEDTRFGRRQWR